MTQRIHDKLIAAAAREVLGPSGFSRRGRSRTWLADHSWFLVVAEFQPSSFSAGSYLNVGATFLWWPKDYLSFDFGHRAEPFADFTDADQFASVASHLAHRARERHEVLRRALVSFRSAAHALRSDESEWGQFHRAMSLGLSGELSDSARAFAQLARLNHDDRAWVLELRAAADSLAVLVADQPRFRVEVGQRIARSRELLSLPHVSTPLGDAA